jgi:hypothetical protein
MSLHQLRSQQHLPLDPLANEGLPLPMSPQYLNHLRSQQRQQVARSRLPNADVPLLLPIVLKRLQITRGLRPRVRGLHGALLRLVPVKVEAEGCCFDERMAMYLNGQRRKGVGKWMYVGKRVDF